jgi:hypothetical protein
MSEEKGRMNYILVLLQPSGRGRVFWQDPGKIYIINQTHVIASDVLGTLGLKDTSYTA